MWARALIISIPALLMGCASDDAPAPVAAHPIVAPGHLFQRRRVPRGFRAGARPLPRPSRDRGGGQHKPQLMGASGNLDVGL